VKTIANLFGIGWAVLYFITLWSGVNDYHLLILAFLNGIWAEVM